MIRCLVKALHSLAFLALLLSAFSQEAWGASGDITIAYPDNYFTATVNFTVGGDFIVTEDSTPWDDTHRPYYKASGDIWYRYAQVRVELDGTTIMSKDFVGCCGVSPIGRAESFGATVYISNLDPSVPHTLTAYLEDVYTVYDGTQWVRMTGDTIAQDSITFRICNGADDPCCQPDADICCWSTDPCCGSTDPCCGSTDPCCGSTDPCCGDPCCEDECCDQGGGGGPGSNAGK